MSVRTSRSVAPIDKSKRVSPPFKQPHDTTPFKDTTNVRQPNAATVEQQPQKVIYTGRGKTRVLKERKSPAGGKRSPAVRPQAGQFNQRLLESSVDGKHQRKKSSPIRARAAAAGHKIKSLLSSKRGGADTPPLKESVQLLASMHQDLNQGGSRDSTPLRGTAEKRVRWTEDENLSSQTEKSRSNTPAKTRDRPDSLDLVLTKFSGVALAVDRLKRELKTIEDRRCQLKSKGTTLSAAPAEQGEVSSETMATMLNGAVKFSQPPTWDEEQKMRTILTRQDEDLRGTLEAFFNDDRVLALLDQPVFDVLLGLYGEVREAAIQTAAFFGLLTESGEIVVPDSGSLNEALDMFASTPNYVSNPNSATFDQSPFPFYGQGHNYWEI